MIFEKWDSMGNFNVLLAVEKNFKIKFSSNQFNEIKSVKEILKIVKKKIKKLEYNLRVLFNKLNIKKRDNILLH